MSTKTIFFWLITFQNYNVIIHRTPRNTWRRIVKSGVIPRYRTKWYLQFIAAFARRRKWQMVTTSKWESCFIFDISDILLAKNPKCKFCAKRLHDQWVKENMKERVVAEFTCKKCNKEAKTSNEFLKERLTCENCDNAYVADWLQRYI